MIKNTKLVALAAALALGAPVFGVSALAQQTAEKKAEQKESVPSAAEMDAFRAVMKIENAAERAAAIKKFLGDHPDTKLASVAYQQLGLTMIEAKAPTDEIVAVAERAFGLLTGPSLAMAYNSVAMELAERGEKLDLALTYAQKAVSGLPSGEAYEGAASMVQDTLGWVHYKRGETEKAVASLATAAAGAPTSQEILYHYGAALEKAGKANEAIDAYIRSLAVFLGKDTRAEAPLQTLYAKTHGSVDGLEARLADARAKSRQHVIFDSRRYEKPAPSWELKDLAGKPVKFDDLKGKVVVMDFWGSWCPPCRMELPYFQQLHDKYKDKGVVFLGMNWERPGTPEERMKAVTNFMAENKYTFPVVIDHDQVAVKALEVRGYPTVFLIDEQGTIRYRNVGYEEGVEQILEAQIEALIRD